MIRKKYNEIQLIKNKIDLNNQKKKNYLTPTIALHHKLVKKKSPLMESLTWPLNSHNCSENDTKIKT